MSVSDFRSDTVTRPSARMRRAMAQAEVGDDVLDGDPTVARLERAAAEWLGKDGAWFVPSGTMANQVALGAWTRPGEEIIAEEGAHLLLFEAGAAGALHGLQAATVAGDRGAMPVEAVRRRIRPDFVHCPRTALLCVEQTHMGSGGRVVPLEHLDALRALADEHGLPIHMDGARLANAQVASGVPAREWAARADSVSVCLSKGLGAPVGSLIAGPREFLERARLVRKRLGGWMRQAGVIAAAGLVALEENIERLAEDHALARQLAERLDGIEGLACAPDEVETNLVLCTIEREGWDAPRLSAALAEEGILVLGLGPRVLRFVTHLDVGEADAERAERALRRVLGA